MFFLVLILALFTTTASDPNWTGGGTLIVWIILVVLCLCGLYGSKD